MFWDGRETRPLPLLDDKSISTHVADINDRGQVVGAASAESFASPRPCLWEQGRVRDLGVAPGHDRGEAVGLNNPGQIVGWSGLRADHAEIQHPVLWQGGKIYHLNQLLSAPAGWRIVQVVDINDRGQILASATRKGRLDAESVLLTPLVHRQGGARAKKPDSKP